MASCGYTATHKLLVAAFVAGLLLPRYNAHTDRLGLGPWLDGEPLSAASTTHFAAFRRQLAQPLRDDGALAVKPRLVAAGGKASGWATVNVDPGTVVRGIPRTFLGISHEWTNLEELNHGGSYLQLLRDLTAYGGGPLVLRIGGGSTDKQTSPAPRSTWDQLRALQHATGMMFIVGLNFQAGDVSLARAQIDATWETLPSYSVMSFEVGNEPNFYEGMHGGKSSREYISCCFINDWNVFVRTLSCRTPSSPASCKRDADFVFGQLAGPAWGHISMSPQTLDWFLRVNYRWMNLVTVHWYHATREAQASPEGLLAEAPLQRDMANLRRLVDTSRRWGKDLRVGEMNTISNSGRAGVSDSLAAALWTLDAALEVAATGATGINLHWGDGFSLYAALLRQAGGASIVKPPYYAYLLLQMALGPGSSILRANLQVSQGSKIKAWALHEDGRGGASPIRVVLINKHKHAGCNVAVQLPAAHGGSGYGSGKLIRLLGRQGLSDEWSVSLGNMTYTLGGEPFGHPAGEVVPPEANQASAAGGQPQLRYSMYMPGSSAALLTIPHA